MNYGKTAYLKVTELEKKINQQSDSKSNTNTGFLEFYKPNLNQDFSNKICNVTFPNIELTQNSEICFQIKFTINSSKDDKLKIKLLLDESEIHAENLNLKAGENQAFVMKTFSPITTCKSSFCIKFKNNEDENLATLANIKVIVMGLSNVSTKNELCLHALSLENNILVSFVDSEMLYYQLCSKSPQTIDQTKFIFLENCISHCFMKNSKNQESIKNLFLLSVDKDKNLKLKSPFNQNQDVLIDENVDFVNGIFIDKLEQNLVTYIKNGEIFFTMINNNHIVTCRKVLSPNLTFKDIQIATNQENEQVFLVATTDQNSSYIFSSVLEADASNKIEFVQAKYMVSVKKYIDMELCDGLSVETLSAKTNFSANRYIVFDSFIKDNSVSNLNCKMDFIDIAKANIDSIVYGVKLDKSNPIGKSWATYTDDAVNFKPAYMDFENDVFVDNGWEERWPYCDIRPCLYDRKNHKVVGYLDKNNYEVFEDQTPATITDDTDFIVMIEFPKIFYKITTDENFNYIQISNSELDGFACYAHQVSNTTSEHIYVAAYAGPGPDYSVINNDVYHFYSGMEIGIQNTALLYTYNASHDYGTNFCTISYPFNTLVCCLFAIMFKSTDVRYSLGVGFTEIQDHYYTGELNKKGMNYGKSTSGHTKLFGMEDYYGLAYTLSCGMYYSHKKEKYFYNKNLSFFFTDASSFQAIEENYPPPPINPNKTVIVNIIGDTRIGFFPLASDKYSDLSLGFCDYGSIYHTTDNSCDIFGNKEGTGGGLFAVQTKTFQNEVGAIIRLMNWENY